MLRTSQILSMRAKFNRLLPDQAVIQRKTVENVGGELVETWNDLVTVPCRVSHIGGGEEGETGGRIVDETTNLVTVAAETDVEEPDRLVIAGTTYEITFVRKRGSWELSRRIECVEAVA